MKRQRSVISLLLCALLLCGCGYTPETTADGAPLGHAAARDFSAMEYTRPELESIASIVDETVAAIEGDAEPDAVYRLLDSCQAELDHFDSMCTLANIRSCQDTSDQYYVSEYSWCSENYSRVTQLMDELDIACADLDYDDEPAEEPQEDEGWTAPSYSDESVELLRRESALVAQYRELIADPVIELDGQSVNRAEYLEWADELEYDRAMQAYCQQYNPKLAELYIKLVRVRKELAASLGYDSYEQMQYEYGFGRDYTPEQADAYIEDVRTYILPLYRSFWSESSYELDYGYMSQQELMTTMRDVTAQMGGELAEAFAYMESFGLYDVEMRPNKANSSFQSYIRDYDAPFLFVGANGDLEDLITMAHEFGHYTDAYVNLGGNESIDLAECYSQAMEYLTLWRLFDLLPKAEAENLRRIKLYDTLDLYASQLSYAQFERRAYAMTEEELSVEGLNALARELAESWGSPDESYSALSWVNIPHLFETPFYVISYPVSNDVSEQIFALEQETEGAGLKKFKELLHRDSNTMIAAAEAAGLSSPFAEGRVQKVAELLERQLEACAA